MVTRDVGSYGSAARIQDHGIKWKVVEEARKHSEETDRGKGEHLGGGG